MNEHPKKSDTATTDLPNELTELSEAIQALPAEHQAKLQPIVNSVVESVGRRRRILSLVQEALSQLRLDMKYLMFDLEATKREKEDLRQQLEG